ncbi:DUF421 domain-containing protein [Microbaculum marinum]|uniref:YetF domain-containing protein n=1 Tax=Microbaculum marinum TaxID=1764581 RepID=A0AAW9RMP9_9HYPH
MDWSGMFFQNWEGLARTLVVGILAYSCLVLFLRISGKRTLAKLNAFDLVVTVALGSTLAAVLLQKSIPLAEGALALALLIVMQLCVTFLSVRWRGFSKAVRSEPALLVRDGELCLQAMRRERITEGEIDSAVRSSGAANLSSEHTVILESDGSISVVTGIPHRLKE